MKKSFLENIKIDAHRTPLYETIQADKNPLFIWGCGSLAYQALQYCKHYGIGISGFFINTGAQETMFEGYPVWEWEDLRKEYAEFSVIIGHSRYQEGRVFLEGLSQVKHVYTITSCCCGFWDVTPPEFLCNRVLDELDRSLEDDKSRLCLTTYFESKINDNPQHMFACFDPKITYYSNDVFELSPHECLVDVGACDGGSISLFHQATLGKYECILAIEPDDENFNRLCEKVKARGMEHVILKQLCAHNENGFVKFEGRMEYGGINPSAKNYRLCPAKRIDDLCGELQLRDKVSIIKINFPFSVPEILNGASCLLKEIAPKLIIRAGFDETVLLDIFSAIREINPSYRFYLRYTVGIPQGLTLFAV